MTRVARNPSGNATVRGLITTCAAVLLVGASIIYWQYTGFSNLQTRVQAAEKQVDEGKTIAERLEQTQQRYQNMVQQLQHLELSVSERAYIPTLLKQLESAAKSHRLTVLSVRPSNPTANPKKAEQQGEEGKDEKKAKPAEPYEQQTIDVAVRGQFWDIMRFTEDLTRFPKILAVDRLQLRPKQRKDPNDPFEVEAQFTLNAFIFRTAAGGTAQ